MCWSTHVMAYTCRDEQMTLWIQVSPFTFPCISGIKLPMPQFYDKRLYLLKPLSPLQEWGCLISLGNIFHVILADKKMFLLLKAFGFLDVGTTK